MNAQNINISLVDILQENVNTQDVADAVIAYYTDIASDMKADDGAVFSDVRAYVEGGAMQAEAASFFEEMFDMVKRDVIRAIITRRVRLSSVEMDVSDNANPGQINGFRTAITS